MRRAFIVLRASSVLVALAVIAASVPLVANPGGVGSARLDLVEATITDIQKALQTRLVTSEQLVQLYLDRIDAFDKPSPGRPNCTTVAATTDCALNSYIHVNLNVLDEARAIDDARHRGNIKMPMFGIPIILKDNIDTFDMPTTAGSLAFAGSIPTSDSFVAKKLRAAGAIIMGKATLTEFANFLTQGMPTGYSSLGGYGYNPYDPRRDPRTALDSYFIPFNNGRPALITGGSSSGPGIAVAANLATIGVGTETSGSILSPGTANMLVGIKPTVGLISRDGIVPITADQDTAGPLARTVTDAAILLGVLAGFDSNDPATAACNTPGNCFSDYTQFLDSNALQGARIAVPPFPTTTPPGGPGDRSAVMNAAIAELRMLGATVDLVPALASQLPGCQVTIPSTFNRPATPPASIVYAYPPAAGCSTVLNYGFKRDLNAYIAAHVNPAFSIHSLLDVVNFNSAHPAATVYGQDLAVFSQFFNTAPGSPDTIRYMSDRATDIAKSTAAILGILNGPDGIPGTSDDYDALLFSGNSGAGTPAKAGYPSIVVPSGFFTNVVNPPFPAGFNALDGPAGITFSGRAFSEPRLIGLAFAYEQATHARISPASAPPLTGDHIQR
jgi:amidase